MRAAPPLTAAVLTASCSCTVLRRRCTRCCTARRAAEYRGGLPPHLIVAAVHGGSAARRLALHSLATVTATTEALHGKVHCTNGRCSDRGQTGVVRALAGMVRHEGPRSRRHERTHLTSTGASNMFENFVLYPVEVVGPWYPPALGLEEACCDTGLHLPTGPMVTLGPFTSRKARSRMSMSSFTWVPWLDKASGALEAPAC